MPAGGLGSPQSLFPLALWDQVALREPPSGEMNLQADAKGGANERLWQAAWGWLP